MSGDNNTQTTFAIDSLYVGKLQVPIERTLQITRVSQHRKFSQSTKDSG